MGEADSGAQAIDGEGWRVEEVERYVQGQGEIQRDRERHIGGGEGEEGRGSEGGKYTDIQSYLKTHQLLGWEAHVGDNPL